MLSWAECPIYIKELWAKQAVAAITAMREPSEKMLLVRENPEEALYYWAPMIDAALKEE